MHIWGFVVNTFTVLAGSALGLLVGFRLGDSVKSVILSGLGLSTVLIGMKMALATEELLLVVASVVLGGVIGELMGIEEWLGRMGEKLKSRTKSGSSTFVLGFVSASLLFCVGPMTVVGSLQDGFARAAELIYTKSLMDGVASIALAASLGPGVIFSALTVLVFQGALTLLGMLLGGSLKPAALNEVSATGGVLILGIGFNLLGMGKLKVGNLLPALLVAAVLSMMWL